MATKKGGGVAAKKKKKKPEPTSGDAAEDAGPKVLSHRTLQDGTKEFTMDNAAVVLQRPDGSQKQIQPDGTSIERFADGKIVQFNPHTKVTTTVTPDGQCEEIHGDGTSVVKRPDGVQVQTNPDGVVISMDPDGTITQKSTDGTTTVQQQDGSYRKVYPDGQGFEFDAQSGKTTRRSSDGFAVQVLYNESAAPTPASPVGSGLAAAKMLKDKADLVSQSKPGSHLVPANGSNTKQVVFRRNSGCIFERKGISLRAIAWLADLADENKKQSVAAQGTPDSSDLATTQDVCDAILKVTAAQKCSWVQWIASSSPDALKDIGLSHKDVGAATVFVSHAWRYTFRETMLSAVESLQGQRDSEEDPHNKEYYWIDVATVNQHYAGSYPQDWWSNTFATGIGVIGKTLLVLSPWNDPIPLKRSWCLWEILNSCEENIKFDIVIPPNEKKAFAQSLVAKWSQVVETMTRVDIENAQAWRPDDQIMIANAVRATSGGFTGLNTRVKDMLRTWLADAGCEQISLREIKQEEGVHWERADDEALAVLRQQVGRLLMEQGKAELAESYLRKSVETVRKLTGEDSERFAKACHFLTWALRQQGKVKEAAEVAEKSHAIMLKMKGPKDPDTEASEMNLWMLRADVCTRNVRLPPHMISIEDKAEAKNMLKNLEDLMSAKVEDYKKRYGDANEKTLSASNNLSSIRSSRGDKSGLAAHYRQSLNKMKASPTRFGPKNPAIFGTMSNLALALDDSKEGYEEAENLLRAGFKGFKEILGQEHPDTLTAMSNLAQHLVKGVKTMLLQSASQSRTEHERKGAEEQANRVGDEALELFEQCYEHLVILQGHSSEGVVHNRACTFQLLLLLKRVEDCKGLLESFEGKLSSLETKSGECEVKRAREMVEMMKLAMKNIA